MAVAFQPVAEVMDFVPVEEVESFAPVEEVQFERVNTGAPVSAQSVSSPRPGQQLVSEVSQPPTVLPQAFPAQEQRAQRAEDIGAERKPMTPETDIAAAVRQEPEKPEAEIQPIGKEGTFLRGATSVAASVLNRPEYIAAMANPATAIAVGVTFLPGVAKQFVEDLGRATQGDNEALGRAAAIGIPALAGVVKTGKTITERLDAQVALERLKAASNAAHIDAMARLELTPTAAQTPPTLLQRATTELAKIPGERKTDASQISPTAEVYGDVRTLAGEGERQVPVQESGAGVQPQAERGIPLREPAAQAARPDDATAEVQAANVPRNVTAEPAALANVPPFEEIKPAPELAEQAPESPAPTAAAVSKAEPTGVAAPSEPPAISEPTISDPFEQIRVQTPNGVRRVVVRASIDPDTNKVDFKGIQLVDDKTGAYEVFNAPPLNREIQSLEEAQRLGNALVREKFKQVLPDQSGGGTEVSKAPARGPVQRPWDIIDEIGSSVGQIRNKKAARPGSEGYYGEGYKNASQGAGRTLFSNKGQSPDEALDALRRSGVLPENATVDDLWDVIQKASNARRARFRGETPDIQAEKFQKSLAEQGKKKGSHFVSVGDLSVGDKFKIGTEELEVVSIDPDTGEVTVKDGRKFGYQTIPDGADIPVQKGSVVLKDKVPAFTGEDFSFNAPESVEQQKLRLAHEAEVAKAKQQREDMEAQAAKPLVGSQGDIGQKDMFGGGDLLSGDFQHKSMGGATPEEFVPPRGTPTSNKNAVVDAERVKRGLEPMMAPMRRSFGDAWDMAMARIDRDPGYQDRLIAELKESPRGTDDIENAALLQRRVDLRNEYDRSARDAAQAYDDGRMEDVASANERTAQWSQKLADLEQVLGRGDEAAGTILGRGLSARRMMMNEDFSLASLETQKRAANGWRPVTDTERAQLAETAKRYEELNKQLQETVAAKEQALIESEARRSLAELQAQAAKTKSVSDYVLKTAEKWVAQWGKEAEVARKNLAGKFLSPSPKDLLDLAKIVRFRIGELGLDIAKITAELVSEFGEGVKPYIEGAFKTAQEMIEKLGETVPKPYRDKVKEVVTKTAPTVETVTEKIAAKAQKEDSASITPQVKELAGMFWQQGIRELNPMIDALHAVLKKVFPEITRQGTMDALSGRGKFTLPSQDAIKKGVRDLSNQARLVAHQIDVEAKRPLPRTGYQPDPMSDAARRELQKLEELKRKFGVVVTDPAKQLASALQQAKTYLRNRMADLRTEIAARERIVKTKTPLKADAELEAMRKEYETVKAEHESVFPKRELTDEQRIAAANRALDRAITNLEADLKAGKLFPDKKTSKTPNTAELQAKRARLEALRDQRQELRDLDQALQAKKAADRLESQKKALEKQIAEQERRLKEGDLAAPPSQVNRPAPPELEPLKQRRDELSKQLAEARKKPADVRAAEAMARRLEAMNKRIAELEAKIRVGDTSTTGRPVNRPMPPGLEQARQALDALNKQLAELRKGPKKSPLEIALQARKTRMTNRIAELEEKIAAGDFTLRQKTPPPEDPQTIALEHKLEQIKKQFYDGLLEDALRKRSIPMKIFGGALESLNAMRALVTSTDLSAVLRQGKFVVLTHPIRGARSIPDMLRAFASEKAQFAVQRQIEKRANYKLYKASKLYLAEHGVSLTKMEEAFMSRWASKIPGVGRIVKASERAYITFLNKLRADSFDAMAKTLVKWKGQPPSIEEARIISNYINQATGRGSFGTSERMAAGLNSIFFSPRYVASRFNMLLGQPLYYGLASGKAHWANTKAARVMVAREYAQLIGGYAVVYALGLAAGGTVETDSRSTDFGKIKFGNTRIDPLAGLSQITVLLGRLWHGEKKTGTGKIVPIRGKVPYGSGDAIDLFKQFVRMKLAPAPSIAADVISGKDALGQPVTPMGELARATVPISVSDIVTELRNEGFPLNVIAGILSIFGESVQNYDATKKPGQR